MAGSLSPEHILAKAEQKEREYDWLVAVGPYENAQSYYLSQKDYLRAGEIQERIGLCLHRAAMQSKSRSEFKKRMRNAIAAYEQANNLYEKVVREQKDARKLRCKALAKYLEY